MINKTTSRGECTEPVHIHHLLNRFGCIPPSLIQWSLVITQTLIFHPIYSCPAGTDTGKRRPIPGIDTKKEELRQVSRGR